MKIAYLIEPPFNYLDRTGTHTGCDIALANYVFAQLGMLRPSFNDWTLICTKTSNSHLKARFCTVASIAPPKASGLLLS